MKPNDILTLDIQALGEDGDGVSKSGRHTVYVPNAFPGERVTAIVSDVAKTYAHANLKRILMASKHRIKPKCWNVDMCGGCQVQELEYSEQLRLKRQKVIENLRVAGVEVDMEIPMTIGCNDVFHFRNKAIYPVAKNSDGQIVAGFYARRSHIIVPSAECPVGADENMKIVEIIISHLNRHEIQPYDEATHTGTVRYILIRKAFHTNSVMVSVVINSQCLPHHNELIERLLDGVKGIKDVSLTVNCDATNRIRGNEVINLFGDGYITEVLGDLKYRISPLAFFQVNTSQAKVLYDKVLEFADLKGDETVFDLYCGVGTIALYLARHCRRVYGVEIIPQAVVDARQNAVLNGINNAEFMEGKSEDVVSELVGNKGVRADVVVVDPPRKGCDRSLLDTIINMRPSRLVYVSCDCKTLARDLKILKDNGFKTKHVQPVDMFPHTVHVESVALVIPIVPPV